MRKHGESTGRKHGTPRNSKCPKPPVSRLRPKAQDTQDSVAARAKAPATQEPEIPYPQLRAEDGRWLASRLVQGAGRLHTIGTVIAPMEAVLTRTVNRYHGVLAATLPP